MKFKQTLTKEIEIQPDDFKEKVISYLLKNHYRITEKGVDYIIFKDDEFSNRKQLGVDIYIRIGTGKFVFNKSHEGHTSAKLIYLTPITYPLFIMVVMSAFGVYIGTISPAIFSLAFTIPIIFRIFAIEGNVFKDVLDC